MNGPTTAPRLTLAQAMTLPQFEWMDLSINDLTLTDGERRRTAALWQWLCGVPPTAPAAARVGNEVLADAELMIALNLPAAEFFLWFRREPWEAFDSTDRTGCEAWAWEALHRAWAGCQALGSLASQRPLQMV